MLPILPGSRTPPLPKRITGRPTIGPNFRLLFGTANERPVKPQPSAAGLIGMGWLYALHVRSSHARGRVWQAEYMVSAMRDQVLALVCLRHGVPTVEGRGIDRLPPEATAAVAGGAGPVT